MASNQGSGRVEPGAADINILHHTCILYDQFIYSHVSSPLHEYCRGALSNNNESQPVFSVMIGYFQCKHAVIVTAVNVFICVECVGLQRFPGSPGVCEWEDDGILRKYQLILFLIMGEFLQP